MTCSRLALTVFAAALTAPLIASADIPTVGNAWVAPTAKTWLGGSPVVTDAAGKVTVYWFCKPKNDACKDDLARLFNMREQGNVYVVAYIGGTKRDARKLDPVRSEVGAGAVAYGPALAKALAKLGVSTAPTSIVVDTEGKVAHVSIGGEPDSLDARDQKVAALVAAIKEFTLRPSGPEQVKPGQRFELKADVELASWLAFDAGVKPEVRLTVPPDVTCDAAGKAIPATLEGRRLTAVVGCTGAVKGSYEARMDLRFGYRALNKAVGVGQDTVSFKFQVRP